MLYDGAGAPRNHRAERLGEERSRLVRRLEWALKQGDEAKARKIERQLGDVERALQTSTDGRARDIERQRDRRRWALELSDIRLG